MIPLEHPTYRNLQIHKSVRITEVKLVFRIYHSDPFRSELELNQNSNSFVWMKLWIAFLKIIYD